MTWDQFEAIRQRAASLRGEDDDKAPAGGGAAADGADDAGDADDDLRAARWDPFDLAQSPTTTTEGGASAASSRGETPTAAAPGSDGGATPSPSRSNFEALWFTSEERLRAEEERESGTAPSDEKEHKRDVWTYGEESPSPPASDDASATGRTYDDVTKLPPPHLRT